MLPSGKKAGKSAVLTGLISLLFLAISFSSAKILINEIMYDLEGADTGREWVELFNQGPETINIIQDKSGFRFFDGSNHLINSPFMGGLILEPSNFLILSNDPAKFLQDNPGFSGNLTKSAFSLNNTADTLKIINESGVVLDEVNYNSNLGAGGNGLSLGLIGGSLKENAPTPGKQNQIPNSLTPSQTTTSSSSQTPVPSVNVATTITTKIYPNSIVINEFLPNPSGDDATGEWIELYNTGDETVNLTSWQLRSDGSKTFSLKGEIGAKSFLAIKRTDSSVAITNDGDTITLLFPTNETAFSISYSGEAPSEQSFARFGANDWRWTKKPTPGEKNAMDPAINAQGQTKTPLPEKGSLNQIPSQETAVNLNNLNRQKTNSKNLSLFLILGILFGVVSAIIVIKITKPL